MTEDVVGGGLAGAQEHEHNQQTCKATMCNRTDFHNIYYGRNVYNVHVSHIFEL